MTRSGLVGNCRRLLTVRGALHRADGKIRNIDEVIAELIEFWKEHSKTLKKLRAYKWK